MQDNPHKIHATKIHFRTVIIGAGFSGLAMAIQLKLTGDNDFLVLEKAADVGGVWHANNYPGCACDVQSHLYSFSFAPNPNWSRMFSPQKEIQAYLRTCTERFGLPPHLRFNTGLERAIWNEVSGLWQITLNNGETITAQFLISGMGHLSRPSVPSIAGLENFRGTLFHSQDWQHDYRLEGKRVAVIGTGASSIQFVPQIQPKVARLDLYQRTPPWILPKPDRAITSTERRLFNQIPAIQQAYRDKIYWTLESRVLGFVVDPRLMATAQKHAKDHIKKHITDPELQQKLTPNYRIGCKRVLVSNDYYPALNKANVDVITFGIQQVNENSITTVDGVIREVDAIILGTGFHATDPMPRGLVFGRQGQDIVDSWQNGAEAYKATTVAGFPNLFLLAGPNTGLGHSSQIYMIESQVAYVLDALKTMSQRNIQSIDVQRQIQTQYNEDLQSRLKKAIWGVGGCQSWYLVEGGKNAVIWPNFTWKFRQQLKRFDIDAYERTSRLSHKKLEEIA
jgi:cation diffusion facilitator CzcD-associated flavoprotein CzcO